jgi:Helix-turn-helix domain
MNTHEQTPSKPLTREQWLLSLPQAQAALGGIGLTMLYKLIDSGSIRRVKIGRRAFITQASIDAFIASLTAA